MPALSRNDARPHRNQRGSAIVIVLAVLILVIALLVAFMSNATREIQSADAARRGVRAADLARTAAELVTAQLHDGTSRGAGYIWATQPGLLRTWGTDGNADIIYKLFSDEQMTATGSAYRPGNDMPPENWRDMPDVYTDVNEQVAEFYPVLDPGAIGRVVGFEVGGGSTPPEDIVAMPVTWLYVLADGSLSAPAPGGAEDEITPVTGASKSNPIVGRIAFWTDDDSTKINVNTAGGDTWPDRNDDGITDDPVVPGAYHDKPHFSTTWDMRRLDARSPYINEYQRTPGHPATTYLSAVFPELDAEQLGAVLPKLQSGGTNGGRKDHNRTSAPTAIRLDNDRLYATIDELAFRPTREQQEAIDPRQLVYTSFFLTSDATSPDTTPFGTPKISLWPIHDVDSPKYRSTYDDVIAFCHEFGEGNNPDEYYFSRRDPLKPKSDFLDLTRNQQLYRYLVEMVTTPMPGFGGTFDLKYGTHDSRQVLTSIYDYIRSTNLRDRGDGSLVPFAPDGLVYPTFIEFDGIRTAGLGRFETVSEIGYLLHQASEPRRATLQDGTEIIERDLRAAVLWESVCLAQGLVGYRQNHIVEIEGLDQLRLDAEDGMDFYINRKLASDIRSDSVDGAGGVSLGLPAKAEIVLNAPATAAPESHPWGGTLSPALNMLHGRGSGASDRAELRAFGEAGDAGYPFVSNRSIRIGAAEDAGTSLREARIKITGARVKFNVLSSDGERTPLGSYTFEFPAINHLPLPVLRRGATPRGSQFRLNSRLALGFGSGGSASGSGLPWHELIHPTDIVRTVQPAARSPLAAAGSGPGPSGDLRHLAILSLTEPSGLDRRAFHPRTDYDATNPIHLPFDSPDPRTRYRCLHSFSTNGGFYYPMQNPQAAFGSLLEGAKSGYFHGETEEQVYYQTPGRIPDNFLTTRRPNFSDNVDGARLANGLPGDWDSGTGFTRDGPFTNKLDDGTVLLESGLGTYFYGSPAESFGETGQYQPNRLVTSAGAFGSLPTGVHRGDPWETLLFNPGPAAGQNHPALEGGPPDHLFLEFFHMPVVGPYALSTPAATAGRVNINTQIAPFTHIRRDTALHAVLAAHRVTVVPGHHANTYKTATGPATASNENYRLPLDLRLTVDGIRRRFDDGRIFRTASEICDEFLVPASPSGSPMFEEYNRDELIALWSNPSRTGLSGDNVREAPYAHLYPKITARSNSFTVHVRAQVITKVRSSTPTAFDPKRDRIDGEWRGSFSLRRQLDPTDERITDYAVERLSGLGTGNGDPTLDELHQIHITNVRRFNPRPTKLYQ